MKKVCYLIMRIALTLIMFGTVSLGARKNKKKAQTPVVLTQPSLLALPGSLENGIMTDLLQDAQSKAKKLELEVAEKTKLLNEQAAERYRAMQEEINQKTREIQELAKKQSEELANKFKQQTQQVQIEVQQTSTALRQQAAQQVVSLFNQAEEEAIRRKREAEEQELRRKRELEEKELKRRRKEREKIITKNLEQQPIKQPLVSSSFLEIDSLAPLDTAQLCPIDSSWKAKTSQEFHNNMALMKKIILEGETESEAQDFMKRFSRQSRWFDTTLSNTTYVCDEYYKEIVKRSTRLHSIVQAQESADRFLKEIAEEKDLTNNEVKKVRLAVLYELNAKINRVTTNKSRGSINDDQIKQIVTQAIQETLSEKNPPHLIAVRRTTTSNSLDQDEVKSIPLTISSTIQNDLETLNQQIKDLKNALTREIKKRKSTKKKAKEKDSKILELEERLTQAQEHISRYKEQISGQKLSLEIQQTEQSKQTSKEAMITIDRLQNDLDQAKKEVGLITGKASSSLASMREEVDEVTKKETELRKKFSKSLEREKAANIELERKSLEILEENKSLTKKLSKAEQETTKAIDQAKQQFKGKLENVNKKLISKEIDVQQATNRSSKLEKSLQNAQKQVLELTQDKFNLVQDKEDAIKQAENKLSRRFKNKVQETEINNINLQIEQRKAESSIAHLKDKIRQTEQEKSQAIDQLSKELQESFEKSLANKEDEKQALQKTMLAQEDEAQKKIETLERKSLQEKDAAVQQAKNELTAAFKPKIEEKEKNAIELEITTRKALEETNKVKSDLINAYKEKDAAIERTTTLLKSSFKPKLEQAHQEKLEAEVKTQRALNQSNQLDQKVRSLEKENTLILKQINTLKTEKDLALDQALKEKDLAVKKTETKMKDFFKPQLEQAHQEKLEAEVRARTMSHKADNLSEKVKYLSEKQEALKSSSKSLLEKSNKKALNHEIEVSRLNAQVEKAESNSIPMDLLDLPTLEMLHQQLNNK